MIDGRLGCGRDDGRSRARGDQLHIKKAGHFKYSITSVRQAYHWALMKLEVTGEADVP